MDDETNRSRWVVAWSLVVAGIVILALTAPLTLVAGCAIATGLLIPKGEE